jgi:hypothetical protein
LPAAVALSLPDWLFEALCERFGEQEARVLGRSLLEPAPLQLRANALKVRREALIEQLGAEGIRARAIDAVPGALEVEGHPALERSAAFAAGAFEVQDAGSQLLALLVGARRGQRVIDLCAGAGGKTLALAAMMNSLGQVFACDVSLSRLQRLRPRLTRSGATNVQPFAIDSLTDRKLERLAARAHAVLVDAPCTGTGTLRRNPDLKWRFGPDDLLRLRDEQRAILSAAARLVAKRRRNGSRRRIPNSSARTQPLCCQPRELCCLRMRFVIGRSCACHTGTVPTHSSAFAGGESGPTRNRVQTLCQAAKISSWRVSSQNAELASACSRQGCALPSNLRFEQASRQPRGTGATQEGLF